MTPPVTGNTAVLRLCTSLFRMPPQTGAAVEQYVYNLSNALALLGVDEHLVTGVQRGAKFNPRVTIHESFTPHFKFDSGFYGWAAGFLVGGVSTFATGFKALLESHRIFNLIHGHDLLSAFLFILAKKLFLVRTPLYFTVHGSSSRRSYYSGLKAFVVAVGRCVELFVWKNADFTIVLGNKARDELVKDWGVPHTKVKVIEQGVDSKFFIPDPSRLQSLEKRYGLSSGYCMFVGRLSPLKGPQYLLQAIRNLDINCLIVGDGPYMKELTKLAKELKVAERVFFPGLLPRTEVRDLYGGALFFVLPTVKEGSPLVILEAMSSSVPVISTNIAGIPDIIIDGYNGFVVPPENANMLREKMQTLAHNRSLRNLMAGHARETAVANDWHIVAKNYCDLYNSAENL